MENPMHNIDNLFFNGLRDHTEHPAEDVWNNIETDLDNDVATTYKRKYKKLRRTAIVLLTTLIGFVFYEAITLYVNNENSDSSKVEKNPNVMATGRDLTTTPAGKSNLTPPTPHSRGGQPPTTPTDDIYKNEMTNDVEIPANRTLLFEVDNINAIADQRNEETYPQSAVTGLEPRL